MYKNLRIVSIVFAVLCFATAALAQETTGIIEITTKDSTDAAVPGVTVTVQNAAGSTGFKRTITTDENGFQRVLQVPPGTYMVVAEEVSGFAKKTVENVKVVLGEAIPVIIELTEGSVDEVVDITAGDNATIDVTTSRIQTNISAEVAELLPKGTNFTSLLKISPATRPESKSGGFQVDGASGSENTFIIDGNEVTNAVDGSLNVNNNLPFNLIQEVQVKSSGFGANYGGATGGVVNIVTKGGNNEFEGEFGLSFEPGKLQAARRDILHIRKGQAIHLRHNDVDSNSGFFPSGTFSGPIVEDRAWFSGSYTPQIFERERTIPYSDLAPLTYQSTERRQYALGRIDAQLHDLLRVTGKFVWNPVSVKGELPALVSQFDAAYPNNGMGLSGVDYQNTRGGRQNANQITVQGVWTPRSDLVVSGRYGRSFLNDKLDSYGVPSVFPIRLGNSRIRCSSFSGTPPPGAQCDAGTGNGIPRLVDQQYDVTVRQTIDFDASYIVDFGGLHEFNVGYQRNNIQNDVFMRRNGDLLLYYTSPGKNNAIDKRSGRNVTPTSGNIGTGRWLRFQRKGSAGSTDTGIYVMDKWQPTDQLTLNLGVRFGKEDVVRFNDFPSVQFGWGDKIAPRIGGAYDLLGDGKTKISGFFGWVYDRFKYYLPRGLFGGEKYDSNWFELFDPNKPFNTYNPANQLGANPPFIQGGRCPQTGTVYGTIRCVVDHRVPSNDNTVDIALQGGVDPDIKPFRQTEITFTFVRELWDNYRLSARYTRKKLDRTVEDSGFFTAEGSEVYIIGNPGFGLTKKFYEQNGWIPRKARRDYDVVEITLNRRLANNFYFNANYAWSRLYGNYSGLASSDEIVSGAMGTLRGRRGPNATRSFDTPFMLTAVATGEETLGRLGTDRPHVFKFSGAYEFDWNDRFNILENHSTQFQTFFTAQSGTPLTEFINIANVRATILNERGDLGRTDVFTETDFALRHRYKFGKDNRFTLVAEVDVLNLFNQNAVTDIFTRSDTTNSFSLTDLANGLITAAEARELENAKGTPRESVVKGRLNILATARLQANGSPSIAARVAAQSPDSRFKEARSFQNPRSFRFGFRFIF